MPSKFNKTKKKKNKTKHSTIFPEHNEVTFPPLGVKTKTEEIPSTPTFGESAAFWKLVLRGIFTALQLNAWLNL